MTLPVSLADRLVSSEEASVVRRVNLDQVDNCHHGAGAKNVCRPIWGLGSIRAEPLLSSVTW